VRARARRTTFGKIEDRDTVICSMRPNGSEGDQTFRKLVESGQPWLKGSIMRPRIGCAIRETTFRRGNPEAFRV